MSAEKTKTLRDLTVLELKAAAFDEQNKMGQAQQILNAILAELNRRDNGQVETR